MYTLLEWTSEESELYSVKGILSRSAMNNRMSVCPEIGTKEWLFSRVLIGFIDNVKIERSSCMVAVRSSSV